jgi:hypothetical protein
MLPLPQAKQDVASGAFYPLHNITSEAAYFQRETAAVEYCRGTGLRGSSSTMHPLVGQPPPVGCLPAESNHAGEAKHRVAVCSKPGLGHRVPGRQHSMAQHKTVHHSTSQYTTCWPPLQGCCKSTAWHITGRAQRRDSMMQHRC